MLTRWQCLFVDGAANLACGALTLSSPMLWFRLDLPPSTRLPAGMGMVTGGVLMLGSQLSLSPASSQADAAVRASASANAVWAALGVTAVNASQRKDARLLLAGIALYDAVMGAAKVLAR